MRDNDIPGCADLWNGVFQIRWELAELSNKEERTKEEELRIVILKQKLNQLKRNISKLKNEYKQKKGMKI